MEEKNLNNKNSAVEIRYLEKVSYAQIEACALEMADLTIVSDPDGVVYRAYTLPLVRHFLAAKYFTDVEVSDVATFEDWEEVYNETELDWAKIYEMGWERVEEIYHLIFESIKLKHERVSSISYKVGKTLDGVLTDDVVKTLAESREVNEKMIDLLKLAEIGKNAKTDDKLIRFAKK